MLGFLYVFQSPIGGLRKGLRFLAVTVLHNPLGQASYPLARIPMCFSHIEEKIEFLAITVHTPRAGMRKGNGKGWREK